MVEQISVQLQGLAVDIDTLSQDPANARTHDEKNLRAIKSSLARFGQRKPIVVRKKGLIVEAGNGTIEAARALGWKQIAAVVVDDDAVTATSFAIADNRSSELATWGDNLDSLLSSLKDEGEDLAALGWSDDDLAAIIGSDDDYEADEGSEEEPPPLGFDVKQGEVWGVGQHRIACGDSRDREVFEHLFSGAVAQVAFTSPPYASQRTYDKASGFEPIAPDAFSSWFEPVQANVKQSLSADGSWFVNIKAHTEDGQRSLYVLDLVADHVRKWGWRFVDEFAWLRTTVPGSWPNRFKNGFEPVFHFSRQKQIIFRASSVRHKSDRAIKYRPCQNFEFGSSGYIETNKKAKADATGDGLALPSNVIEANKSRKAHGHSAIFPLALPRFFIKAFSDSGQIIFDPFLGSGTTVLEAAALDRIGYGIEISPKYAASSIAALSQQLGLEPERIS